MKAFDRIAANTRGRRVYKDPRQGLLFGVCAGLAQYLGLPPLAIRVPAVLALMFWTVPTAVLYGALALLLPTKPGTRVDEAFDRYTQRYGRRS